MSTFDVDPTEIAKSGIEDITYFKHYFDNQDAFNELPHYYKPDNCRFEDREGHLESVQQSLDKYYCMLEVVTELDPYCAVVEKGTDCFVE